MSRYYERPFCLAPLAKALRVNSAPAIPEKAGIKKSDLMINGGGVV